MNMGSLAETYLTAYGWKLYGVMYLVFWVSKVMLYPIARFVIDAALEFSIKGGDPKAALRDVFIRFSIMITVFLLGVMPVVRYNASAAVIEMPGCGTKDVSEYKEKYDRRFEGGTSARVPLLPYAAMLVSSGVNAAILKSMPCAADLLMANQITNNLSMPSTEKGRALSAEATAFNQQCYGAAKDYDLTNSNSSDPLRKEIMAQLKAEYYPSDDDVRYNQSAGIYTDGELKSGHEYAGSNYFNKVFYTDEACDSFTPSTGGWGQRQTDMENTWKDMCLSIRNNRVLTNYAKASTPSNTNSQLQQNQGVDSVRCGDWWNGSQGDSGLKSRLASAGFESAVTQFASTLTEDNKSDVMPHVGKRLDLKKWNDNRDAYIQELYSELPELLKEGFIYRMSEASARQDHSVLSDGAKTAIITTGIFKFVTDRGGTIGELTGLVMNATIAKAVVTLAHPVLLMLIYSLWLLYLVIGEFKGIILIKGLLMIFVIKFCTSVFAIADRLSDELVLLLVPNFTDSLWNIIKTSPDVAIIYMVGTLMYMAVPAIMMYMVAAAGGPSEARGLSHTAGDSGTKIGDQGGKITGSGVRSATNAVEGGLKEGVGSVRQRYFPKNSK